MHSNVSKISAFLCTLVLTACGGETITVNTPPPPNEYLVCAELPNPPDISPLTPIVASNGTKLYLKAEVDTRDGEIARWLIAVRGAWFSCANNLAKVRDYYEAAE